MAKVIWYVNKNTSYQGFRKQYTPMTTPPTEIYLHQNKKTIFPESNRS